MANCGSHKNDKMLIKKYRNKLYDYLSKMDLDIAEFSLEDIESEVDITRLTYKKGGSKMWFDFRSSPEAFHKIDSRHTLFGKEYLLSDWRPTSDWGDFNKALVNLEYWISNYLSDFVYEIKIDDLWTIANTSNRSLKPETIDFDDDSLFSDEEKAQLKLGISEVKILINNELTLNDSQKLLVKKRLEYLEKAIGRNTKTDWKGITISTIIGLILNLGVDTQMGDDIWNLFKKVFANLPNLQLPF